MSFDVYLQRFVNGEAAGSDARPIREFIPADQHEITLDDGTDVELTVSGSHDSIDGVAIHAWGLGPSLANLAFNVARAGDMVIMPAGDGDSIVVLVSETQALHLPKDMTSVLAPVVVSSASELCQLLERGFEAWTRYRDQIVGEADGAQATPDDAE